MHALRCGGRRPQPPRILLQAAQTEQGDIDRRLHVLDGRGELGVCAGGRRGEASDALAPPMLHWSFMPCATISSAVFRPPHVGAVKVCGTRGAEHEPL